MTLHSYLPQDRLRALAGNQALPHRTTGEALFADISGFTPLTEALVRELGARRGMEELAHQVNAVYEALIAEIERYGGSVISFAGDAITCWFDDLNSALPSPTTAARAVSAAWTMQSAMSAFPRLGLKVAVATGPARRFLVGDPAIHYLDALAGDTVTRSASADHLAKRGDVLVDEATAQALSPALTIHEWRTNDESGERFAVINDCRLSIVDFRLQNLNLQSSISNLQSSLLRPFLLPAVYEREVSGQGSFLTELRPCAVLFVRFVGIDYDADQAQAHLDAFIRQMQAIVARYEGVLLQLTIGDKGSYVYVNFGGLLAHEDDAHRAVKAALELRAASDLQLQMGITHGMMRVGAYGGSTRHTYGALGDEVNLSARLMSTAAPGEILVSGALQKAVEQRFTFEPRPPLSLKGKTEPLPVFAVTGERQQRAIRLQEPTYALPMVGRQNELQIIEAKLELALSGRSQVIGITAEAGLGKSRLVAEVIRSARRKGFAGYGGACQSDGIHTPYLAWKSIWSAFFDVDPSAPLRKQMRLLEGEIEDRAPSRLEALPLLGPLLNLNIPDNEFTRALEPKVRQSALHALLEDCLKAAAQEEPLLIVIEDLHWIDALSHDLLDELAKALAQQPVCFVLAYRPPQLERLQAPRLETLPQFTRIELSELNTAEAGQAIRAKLAQLYPARGGAVPPVLVDKLMARAQGNPFYLEELLNFLHDRGFDPRDPSALEKIELPDSLHSLILSRIDQLTESEKTTLRVASIIGRLFRSNWLTGYYPALGNLPQVKVDLDALSTLDITPLDTPEPELAYLFKHIVTHEVTYESLPFATRSNLHEQLALYLEASYPDSPPLETLAFHYGRSDNADKQREYLNKAGEAAQKAFANEAALAYYGQILPLLLNPAEKIAVHLKRGVVLELMGQFADAETDYRLALETAQDQQHAAATAEAQFELGKLNRLRGDFEAALEWLAQAKLGRTALDDRMGLGGVLTETGTVWWSKGEYALARQVLHEGLALARAAGDRRGTARALNSLGIVAMETGDYPAAQALHEESLSLQREIGNKAGISASLNNLGIVALDKGDYSAARALHEEDLELSREMGNKVGIASSLNNLGGVALMQGDYLPARALHEESLALRREMGDQWGIAMSLGNLGLLALAQGDYPTARARHEESLALCREIGDKTGIATALNELGVLALAQGDTTAAWARFEESLALCHEMGDKRGIATSVINLGTVALELGDTTAARARFEDSLALCREMDNKSSMAYALLGLGLLDLAQGVSAGGMVAAIAEARQHITDSLRLRQELGEPRPLTSSLIGMAGLALQTDNARRAAQLLGAVDATLKALKAVIEPEILHFHARTLTATRSTMGDAAFQAAWAQGEKLSLEEAVRLTEEDISGLSPDT